MGGMFVLTLYLQVTKGYSALEAGSAMTPIAIGLIIGAARSDALVRRAGPARVIALGLVVIAAALLVTFTWSPDTAYWVLAVTFFFLALGMGLVNAPGTDLTMGSVPEEKAGIASGVNSVARQVGGAIGVAIAGSVATSVYAGRVNDATHGLPVPLQNAADDSVAAAHGIGAGMPGGAGDALVASADHAWTDALAIGVAPAAAIALLVAVVVLRRLPGRARAGRDQGSVVTPSARAMHGGGVG